VALPIVAGQEPCQQFRDIKDGDEERRISADRAEDDPGPAREVVSGKPAGSPAPAIVMSAHSATMSTVATTPSHPRQRTLSIVAGSPGASNIAGQR
jgi:hypothetical protein